MGRGRVTAAVGVREKRVGAQTPVTNHDLLDHLRGIQKLLVAFRRNTETTKTIGAFSQSGVLTVRCECATIIVYDRNFTP